MKPILQKTQADLTIWDTYFGLVKVLRFIRFSLIKYVNLT